MTTRWDALRWRWVGVGLSGMDLMEGNPQLYKDCHEFQNIDVGGFGFQGRLRIVAPVVPVGGVLETTFLEIRQREMPHVVELVQGRPTAK